MLDSIIVSSLLPIVEPLWHMVACVCVQESVCTSVCMCNMNPYSVRPADTIVLCCHLFALLCACGCLCVYVPVYESICMNILMCNSYRNHLYIQCECMCDSSACLCMMKILTIFVAQLWVDVSGNP